MTDGFTVSPVTARNRDQFEFLFEGRGGPKTCWCMIWRPYEASLDLADKAARKAGMNDHIAVGIPVGLIGSLDGVPMAWCSVAPRQTFKASLGGPVEPGDADRSIWSLTCLFVKTAMRGRGVSTKLVAAAIDHARTEGADILEAYPVAPDSPSYRFSGFVGLFEAQGFQKTGTIGTRRHVYRKTL